MRSRAVTGVTGRPSSASRAPRNSHGLLYLLPGVNASDGLQKRVVHRLHPQGKAVEPRLAQPLQGLSVRGGVGICLQGDLRMLVHLI